MDETNLRRPSNPSGPLEGETLAGLPHPVGGRGSMPPPVTLAILVICGAIWAGLNFLPREGGSRLIVEILAPSAFQIWGGAYWGLVTAAFVHFDFVHALFNMWWTKDFGRLLEPRLGVGKFILFIVCSAIVSSGWQLAVSNQTGIGFSGVVYSFFGYVLAARGRDPVYRAFLNATTIRWMLGWLVLCIALTQMKIWNIANTAHFAGFIFGSLIGVSTGSGRFVIPARIAVVVVAACALVPVFYMPWSEVWRYRRAFQELVSLCGRGAFSS
jgi:membrane associated rhomboid family serine protease